METKYQKGMPDFNIIPEIDVKQKDTGKTIKQKVFLANFDNKVMDDYGRSRFDNKLNFIVYCRKGTEFDLTVPKISCSHFACDKNNNIHRAYFAGWGRNNVVNRIGFIFDLNGSDISVCGKMDLYLYNYGYPIMNFLIPTDILSQDRYEWLMDYKQNEEAFNQKALGKKYHYPKERCNPITTVTTGKPFAKTFLVPKDNDIDTKKKILGAFADADRRFLQNVKKFIDFYQKNYMDEIKQITTNSPKDIEDRLKSIAVKLNKKWHELNGSENWKKYITRGIIIEQNKDGEYNININNHMANLCVDGKLKQDILPWSEFVLIPKKDSYFLNKFGKTECNPDADDKINDYEEFALDEKNGEDKLLSSYGIIPVKTLVCDITNDNLKEDTIKRNIYDIVEFQQGKNLPIIYTFKKVKEIYEFKPMLLSDLIEEVKDRKCCSTYYGKYFRDKDMKKLLSETKKYEKQKIEEILNNVANGYDFNDKKIHDNLKVRKCDIEILLQKLCKTDDIAIQIDYLLNNLQQVREGAKNISSQEEKDREKRIKQQEEFKNYKINCILKKNKNTLKNNNKTEVNKVIQGVIAESQAKHYLWNHNYNEEFDRKILQNKQKNINKTINKIQENTNISNTTNLSKNRKSLNQ